MLTLMLMSQPAISVVLNTITEKKYILDVVIHGKTYHYHINLIP